MSQILHKLNNIKSIQISHEWNLIPLSTTQKML